MHEVLVNRLGGLSLSRKSVVRSTDRPDMTFDVYRGRKTTTQQQQHICKSFPFQYYAESHAVIYIVDSVDKDRIEESKEAFGEWLDPIALRKAKIVCNFGLYECSRVKEDLHSVT